MNKIMTLLGAYLLDFRLFSRSKASSLPEETVSVAGSEESVTVYTRLFDLLDCFCASLEESLMIRERFFFFGGSVSVSVSDSGDFSFLLCLLLTAEQRKKLVGFYSFEIVIVKFLVCWKDIYFER